MKLITDESFLRQVSQPVSVGEGLRIGRDMHTFLLKYNKERQSNKGIGLSAVQVGLLKRVVIINLPSLGKLTFVNPRITKHSDFQIPFTEGCLSLPGKEVSTYRYPWIEVQADNQPKQIFGNHGMKRGDVLHAIVIQHEIDHLDGILITDRTKDLTPHYKDVINGFCFNEHAEIIKTNDWLHLPTS